MTEEDIYKIIDYDNQVKQVRYYRNWCFVLCVTTFLATVLGVTQ